ncbi:MAG: NRDE family protein [Gammaproteobacteria bacterium]
MCLILFSWQQYPDYPLVLAANRDELYERPTAVLDRWQDPRGIVGGRDLQAGGSWLAANQRGRFAAVTNVRDQGTMPDNPRSRGSLITDFLTTDLALDDWLAKLQRTRGQYSGYNLLAGEIASAQLRYYNNQKDSLRTLGPGLFGLSNGELDEPWPKVNRGKQLLEHAIRTDGEVKISDLLSLLADDRLPEDSALPDTGVGLELERLLAPIRIRGDRYGTCSSSVLVASNNGQLNLHEQNRRPGSPSTLISHSWSLVTADKTE